MADLATLRQEAAHAMSAAAARNSVRIVEGRYRPFGGIAIVFKGDERHAERVAPYLDEASTRAPYDSRGMNYYPVSVVVRGRLPNGQTQDVAAVLLKSLGLMPGDLCYATFRDGVELPDVEKMREQVAQWPGEGTKALLEDLRTADPSDDSAFDAFRRDLGLFAARRFLAHAGLVDTGAPVLWSGVLSPYAGVFQAYQELFPGLEADFTLYNRILIQTHERDGDTRAAALARAVLERALQRR